MAKLASLVEGIASALQVAPSRVRTAAAQLRKHKLLTTGPRGPGAPEMSPEDATNLLLAVMYDGELADAHDTVSRLRNATIVRFQGRRWGEESADLDHLPKNGFLTTSDGKPFALGEVLEIMLDGWIRFGTLYEGDEDDVDLEPVNIDLEISCPGYRAMMTFNTPCSLFWRLEYEWKSPEQIKYEATTGKYGTRWDARNGPHIWSSRSVGEDCLRLVADTLRGCEWNDDWEEFTPSYASVSEPEPQPA